MSIALIRELEMKVAREYVLLQGETRQMIIDAAKMKAHTKQDVVENKGAMEVHYEEIK